jgi:hypothetical protein
MLLAISQVETRGFSSTLRRTSISTFSSNRRCSRFLFLKTAVAPKFEPYKFTRVWNFPVRKTVAVTPYGLISIFITFNVNFKHIGEIIIHIQHNRPDIIILNKQQKQAYLLGIAVPNSHNITQTYNTKINKYLELSVAMRNLWCLEKNSILPLISATGEHISG